MIRRRIIPVTQYRERSLYDYFATLDTRLLSQEKLRFDVDTLLNETNPSRSQIERSLNDLMIVRSGIDRSLNNMRAEIEKTDLLADANTMLVDKLYQIGGLEPDFEWLARLVPRMIPVTAPQWSLWPSLRIMLETALISSANKHFPHQSLQIRYEYMEKTNAYGFTQPYYFAKLLGNSRDVLVEGQAVYFFWREICVVVKLVEAVRGLVKQRRSE
ncbi:hypothetical protein BU23DRAFT_655857 [Bimuria novae-zelandiae CBS 107.79]|uniref:Uncharacterized protein n=1 Tax=Bimuria novae-zelandiae CBS 107.79 TaxID=1447943 RepID=A0A6A5UUB3_9PLEO|nr:hypothetical protein BU23DRAFT_655857 [Bimuria novae-zelandiae CBS 107.79]